jgi:lipopolysaccharide export system permease protein
VERAQGASPGGGARVVIGIGWTLGRYFFRRFTQWILGVFLTVFGLIYLLDFVEFLRRSGDTKGATVPLIAMLSLYRTPVIAEQVMPFAVMFGSMGAFLALSRKLELVVARAAGISVWQFAFPALLAAGLGGILATTVYDPASALLKQRADAIEAKFIGAKQDIGPAGKVTWIRQRSSEGQDILRVKFAANGGANLEGVTVFRFEDDGRFKERVDAQSADLHDGFWLLHKARVLIPGVVPQDHAEYKVATNLKLDQLSQAFLPPENVPFWELPRIVAQSELAGLDATGYRMRYDKLIAQPAMFLAMVLVAATVSLRFFRFGGVASMVLAGVLAGFVLYVASELVENLGAAGIVGPVVAAWLPATVGVLLGVLSLLHQEDG